MKLSVKFVAIAATAAAVSVAHATPRAAEASGADYLVAAENLNGLHIGAYYRYTSREINHGVYSLSQDNIAGILGLDLLDWISVYGIFGTADAQLKNDFGGYRSDRDYDLIYGGGGWINILDHDLISNLSCETRIRLTASAQITFGKPEIAGIESAYSDFYGAVTLGVVNELLGNKNMWPDAIGVFVGPVWSIFDCDEWETTGDEMGFAFGLDLYITRRVGLSASYETYGSDDDAVNFSLNVRF